MQKFAEKKANTGEKLYCLDTYALVEIRKGNPRFAWLTNEKFVISEISLCEFYGVIYREDGLQEAESWLKKLEPFIVINSLDILINAVRFRADAKTKNISFFDAVGYCTAIAHNLLFVTGDKEFKKLPNVKFIKATSIPIKKPKQ